MLTDLSVHEFFQKMSGKHAPGSGSGAAMAGLIGVSLLEKVAALSSGSVNVLELEEIHHHLEVAVERDAEVLAKALPALMAIGPDGDSQEWNEILLEASEVPVSIACQCFEALEIARTLCNVVPANLFCDIKFAAMSCHSGLQGANLLAELNLSLLRGDGLAGERKMDQISQLRDRSGLLLDCILG